MVATFARLKLKLLRNSVRGKPQDVVSLLLAMFMGVGLVFGTVAAVVYLRTQAPELVGLWVINLFALLSVVWLIFPMLAGSTDGTVDPAKLAHLPLTDWNWITGLLTAAMVGVAPIATLLFLILWVVTAQTIGQGLYLLASSMVLLAICVVSAQAGTAFMSGLVRGRKTRDIAGALLAMFAVSFGFGFQFVVDPLFDLTEAQLGLGARWFRWLPGGWIGQGVAWSRDGDWIKAGGALVAGVGYVAVVSMVWWRQLQTLLTSTEERGGNGAKSDRFMPPVGELLPLDIRTSLARSLKEIRRDPRIWTTVVGQLPLIIILGFPISQWDNERLVLFSGMIGFYGGMLTANLFGVDSRSAWIDLSAAPSMRPILWGKSLAYALLVGPLGIVMALVLVLWKGGAVYMVGGIALTVAGFGAVAHVMIPTSVIHPIPLLEETNLFGGQAGGSVSAGIRVLIAIFLGSLYVAPAAGLMAGAAWLSPWATIAASPVVAVWGWLLWTRGIDKAENRIHTDQSKFLAALTP